MKILGTDSGLERTGYSIFEKTGNEYSLQEYGYIHTEKIYSLPERLSSIHEQFITVLDNQRPDIVVFERLLFYNNQKSMVEVAQAQGVLLLLAGQRHMQVEFLTPLQIKQTVTGNGTADKKSVQKMVQILLRMKEMPKPDDVVDAIACGMAYCILNR